MPPRYRLLIGSLGAFLVVGGALGAWSGARLDGWPQVRGVFGGIIAIAVGLRILMYAFSNRLPPWLAAVLGDPTNPES